MKQPCLFSRIEVMDMQAMERAEVMGVVKECMGEYMDNWVIWGSLLILLFVLLMGNTISFWLGVLVGLAIPYYIIPHYFCSESQE